MGDISITVEDVYKRLTDLNVNKSPGPDNVKCVGPTHRIDAFYTWLPMHFNHTQLIFSKSISEGKIPEDWKEPDITAIHKKGDKRLTENYRPISLTSVCCKVLEKIVREKREEYLELNNLLSQKKSKKICCGFTGLCH